MEIELGDKVKCKYTGFIGIAVSKTIFINGCVQYEVVNKVGKDNKFPDGVCIDENSLDIIKKKRKPVEEEYTGGPSRRAVKLRGY